MNTLIKLKALEKLASWGDIVNAGYSTMCNGSPFAPRPFEPGTNNVKSTEKIKQEQVNNVRGGAIGLSLAAPMLGGAFATAPGVAATFGVTGTIDSLAGGASPGQAAMNGLAEASLGYAGRGVKLLGKGLKTGFGVAKKLIGK